MAEEICDEKALRFTALRRKVLKLVWSSHEPVKAYDLLAQLGHKTSTAKPPTVYRTLGFLLENGLIHKLDSLNAFVGCAHPGQHDQCYFLVCSRCGETQECCQEQLASSLASLARKNKFQVNHITLEMQGLCHACSVKG